MPEKSQVRLFTKGRIAYVSLHRPAKHNGLTDTMIRELIATAKEIRSNKSIRAVILYGAGKSFCSGLDFREMSAKPSSLVRLFMKLPWVKANSFQRVAYVWRTLPVPVICVVHGNCFGGGLQIALGCDYRIATPDAKLSVMEIKWGLIPDMSLTTTMTTLTRYDLALELTMTGRVFSGIQAGEYGLISKISFEPMDDAEMLADEICQQSPDAIAASKKLFKKTWKANPRRSLWWERFLQLRLLGRKNQRIAMKNGLHAKHFPQVFEDRSVF
ncbi:crotonase/enoyl-CoA hydratase family protein [Endozoicomonadaceae bacterium StTr2]